MKRKLDDGCRDEYGDFAPDRCNTASAHPAPARSLCSDGSGPVFHLPASGRRVLPAADQVRRASRWLDRGGGAKMVG